MEAIEKIVLDAHNNKAFYRSEHEWHGGQLFIQNGSFHIPQFAMDNELKELKLKYGQLLQNLEQNIRKDDKEAIIRDVNMVIAEALALKAKLEIEWKV